MRCDYVYYCGKKCQIEDRESHQSLCGLVREVLGPEPEIPEIYLQERMGERDFSETELFEELVNKPYSVFKKCDPDLITSTTTAAATAAYSLRLFYQTFSISNPRLCRDKILQQLPPTYSSDSWTIDFKDNPILIANNRKILKIVLFFQAFKKILPFISVFGNLLKHEEFSERNFFATSVCLYPTNLIKLYPDINDVFSGKDMAFITGLPKKKFLRGIKHLHKQNPDLKPTYEEYRNRPAKQDLISQRENIATLESLGFIFPPKKGGTNWTHLLKVSRFLYNYGIAAIVNDLLGDKIFPKQVVKRKSMFHFFYNGWRFNTEKND